MGKDLAEEAHKLADTVAEKLHMNGGEYDIS